MAEMQTQEGGHQKSGGIRSKKLSTKVDLTPMVDLGFLLITFFIFTTKLSEAKVMNLNMLMDSKQTTDVSVEKVLTIIPSGNNQVNYYLRDDPAAMQVTNYAADGIRSVIQKKMKDMKQRFGDAQQIVVLIKPTDQSTYQNLVDILDEMKINGVNRYMLLDAETKEKQWVKE